MLRDHYDISRHDLRRSTNTAHSMRDVKFKVTSRSRVEITFDAFCALMEMTKCICYVGWVIDQPLDSTTDSAPR
jgi:hypothetical protein